MSLRQLVTRDELDMILDEANGNVIILKNSITCPISHEAYRQFEKVANELETIDLYYLNVQEARPLSNDIAERWQIKHESPQVLIIENGSVTWHTSHWDITYNTLKEKLK